MSLLFSVPMEKSHRSPNLKREVAGFILTFRETEALRERDNSRPPSAEPWHSWGGCSVPQFTAAGTGNTGTMRFDTWETPTYF